MVKVSVIVPVYNVEKYLEDCLDSILNQTLTDIEVICVNDGSTDKSGEILKNYQNKDSRIKIITQKNHGLGYARNVGMDNAQGEYICFIDSDDYFKQNALKELYNASFKNNIDIVMFKLLNFNDETGETSPMRYFDMPFLKKFNDEVFNWSDVYSEVLSISVTAPGKLFKREFIDKLRFPLNIIFEDTPFIVEALFMADKLMFIDEYYYMRRVRRDSITNSNFTHFSDCIEIFNMVEDIARKYGYYDNNRELMFSRKYLNIQRRFLEVRNDDKKDFFDKIKSDIDLRKKDLDIDFNKIKPKALHTYNAAINCDNYYDFELKLESFSKKQKQDKQLKKSFFTKLKNFVKN